MNCKTCERVRVFARERLARLKRKPKALPLPGPPYRNIPPERRK